jgi:hypothetical protein
MFGTLDSSYAFVTHSVWDWLTSLQDDLKASHDNKFSGLFPVIGPRFLSPRTPHMLLCSHPVLTFKVVYSPFWLLVYLINFIVYYLLVLLLILWSFESLFSRQFSLFVRMDYWYSIRLPLILPSFCAGFLTLKVSVTFEVNRYNTGSHLTLRENEVLLAGRLRPLQMCCCPRGYCDRTNLIIRLDIKFVFRK